MKKFYLLLFLSCFKIMAQAPELDHTFNVKETGIYQQNIGRGAVVLPNGKILSVFGNSSESNVILLNTDGSRDKNFNTTDSFTKEDIRIFAKSDGKFLTLDYDGKLQSFNADGTLNSGFTTATLTNVSSVEVKIKDIIYQDDGKAIIYGGFQQVNDIYTGGCVRLNADGSLDGTFKMQSGGNKLVIQSDGKYVVAQRTSISRYLADGKIDPTFKVIATIDPLQKYVTNGFETENNSIINDFVVQPDGKIIAVGCNYVENSKTFSYQIVRLNANGTRDTSFKKFDSQTPNLMMVYLQKDNKIVLNTENNRSFIRLNTDGTTDNTFKYSNTVSMLNEGALSFQENKMIISGNFKDSKGITRTRIHRINSDGTIDLTFNPHSGPNLYFDEWEDNGQYPYTAKVLLDQKILLIGDFSSYNDIGVRNICRITQDGELDPTFKLDPSVNIYAEISQIGYSVIQQNDGKIILLHDDGFTANNASKSIIRLNSDGSIDNSFNFNPLNKSGSVSDIKMLSNGKFLITGTNGFFQSKVGDYNSYNVVRLNSDGSFDTTYKPAFFHKPMKMFTLSNNKVLISFMKDSYSHTYYPVLKLNEDGTTDSSFKSGYKPYSQVKELNDGKLLITYYDQYYFGPVRDDTFLTRINADGSSDPSFTTYSFVESKVNRFNFYENGQINIFLSYNATNTTDKLTLDSDGKFLNKTVYNTSREFEVQNCEDLLFYGYFTTVENINKNGIVRYKTSNLESNPNPLGEIFQPFSTGQTLEDLKVTGTDIKWYTIQSDCGINNKLTKKGNSTEIALPSSTVIVAGTTYYASQTVNGIESSYRLPVTVYSATLGVKNDILSNLVTYPNPIKDYYTISNTEEINEVEVYNLSGQLQFRNSYNNTNIKIDFTSLSSGLYFVKIFSAGKIATIKTIKN